MKYLEQLKERHQTFKAWQKRPYQVAPLSADAHDCATCGTHYEGNYCPRCGQSAMIGRYSFKNAILLFLDVWGLGNRGMFRTLRDLLLRPGYMIRDYLSGMQMAYFPPFKLFFLVIAFSVVVESGFNILGENRFKQELATYETGMNVHFSSDDQEDGDGEMSIADNEDKEKVKDFAISVSQSIKDFGLWAMNHQSFFQFFSLLLFTVPIWLFFRQSPAYPDIRLSECLVVMVYTSAMMTIVSTACGLLCLDRFFTIAVSYYAGIISIKQLSGYGFWKTLFRLLMAFGTVAILIAEVVFVIGFFISIKTSLL